MTFLIVSLWMWIQQKEYQRRVKKCTTTDVYLYHLPR